MPCERIGMVTKDATSSPGTGIVNPKRGSNPAMVEGEGVGNAAMRSHDGRKEARILAIAMCVFLLIILTLRAIAN